MLIHSGLSGESGLQIPAEESGQNFYCGWSFNVYNRIRIVGDGDSLFLFFRGNSFFPSIFFLLGKIFKLENILGGFVVLLFLSPPFLVRYFFHADKIKSNFSLNVSTVNNKCFRLFQQFSVVQIDCEDLLVFLFRSVGLVFY